MKATEFVKGKWVLAEKCPTAAIYRYRTLKGWRPCEMGVGGVLESALYIVKQKLHGVKITLQGLLSGPQIAWL